MVIKYKKTHTFTKAMFRNQVYGKYSLAPIKVCNGNTSELHSRFTPGLVTPTNLNLSLHLPTLTLFRPTTIKHVCHTTFHVLFVFQLLYDALPNGES